MIPILYSSVTEGTVPSHNGVGPLTDCISCKVTEERNGAFELVMEYHEAGVNAFYIAVNTFIKAQTAPNGAEQLFRVYKVSKVLNGKFTVYAQHISYDLSGKLVIAGTANSLSQACAMLTASAGNFAITTNKTSNVPFKVKEPSSVRSWLGGKEGSFLDIYGGEWEFNNYTATLKANRGADRGVQIRYAKNLTELSQEINIENLCTGVLPYCIKDDGTVIPGAKVNTGLVLDVPKDISVDFSQDVDFESATNITTQLATLASNYIASRQMTTLFDSLNVEFELLGDEQVYLCDTVHIYFDALSINTSAKVVKTEYDVLLDRYKKVTVGNTRSNISDTFVEIQQEVKETRGQMADAIAHATELITGNLGGYVILHDSDADSFPDEILIMDTPDITTAQKVWRWNKNGLGYSGSGYVGPFSTLALTADGKIVADAITTGTLNADLIKAGIISDANNKFAINMTDGSSVLDQMKSKTSVSIVTSGLADRAKIGFNQNDGTYFRAYHTDGTLLASLEGQSTGFGQMLVMGPNGSYLGAVTASSDGGTLWLKEKNNHAIVSLRDTNDKQLVTLQTKSDGGQLAIIEPNGDTQVQIYSSSSGGQINLHEHDGSTGSGFYIKDENLNNLVGLYTTTNGASFYLGKRSNGMPRLLCQIASDGGYISVGSNTLTTVGYLCANSAGGGTMALKNASNTVTITCSGDTGNITCVSLTQTSSRKVKKNVKPIKDAKKILELEAVQFDYKEAAQGKNKRGFIAEDVAEVLPNLVTEETEETPATLDYMQMIPYLQAVIKDQEARIKALEDKLKNLEV